MCNSGHLVKGYQRLFVSTKIEIILLNYVGEYEHYEQMDTT